MVHLGHSIHHGHYVFRWPKVHLGCIQQELLIDLVVHLCSWSYFIFQPWLFVQDPYDAKCCYLTSLDGYGKRNISWTRPVRALEYLKSQEMVRGSPEFFLWKPSSMLKLVIFRLK